MDQKIRREKADSLSTPFENDKQGDGRNYPDFQMIAAWNWLNFFSTCSGIPSEYIVIQWDGAQITLDQVISTGATEHNIDRLREIK